MTEKTKRSKVKKKNTDREKRERFQNKKPIRKYTNKRINEKKRKRRSMNSRVEYFNILKSVMWESVESVC